jgi:hypothetical protein
MMWPWFPGLPLHGNLRAWSRLGRLRRRGVPICTVDTASNQQASRASWPLALAVEVCAAGAAGAQAILIQKTFKRIRGPRDCGFFYLYVKASGARRPRHLRPNFGDGDATLNGKA